MNIDTDRIEEKNETNLFSNKIDSNKLNDEKNDNSNNQNNTEIIVADEETGAPINQKNREIIVADEEKPSNPTKIHSQEELVDSEHMFTMIIHRYDAELSQTQAIKREAVFKITVIGFLITLGIGIFGINGFDIKEFMYYIRNTIYTIFTNLINGNNVEFSNITPILNPIFITAIISIIFIIICLISSISIILHIERNIGYNNNHNIINTKQSQNPITKTKNNKSNHKNSKDNKYFWIFPDNKYINSICTDSYILPTSNEVNKRLAEIIKYNSINNDFARTKGNWALVWLIAAVIFELILFILLSLNL